MNGKSSTFSFLHPLLPHIQGVFVSIIFPQCWQLIYIARLSKRRKQIPYPIAPLMRTAIKGCETGRSRKKIIRPTPVPITPLSSSRILNHSLAVNRSHVSVVSPETIVQSCLQQCFAALRTFPAIDVGSFGFSRAAPQTVGVSGPKTAGNPAPTATAVRTLHDC